MHPEFWRIAIDSLPTAVFVANSEGNVVYVNPALQKLTGYALSELLGKSARVLTAGDATPAESDPFALAKRNREPWSGTVQIRRKNGECVSLAATVAALVDGESGQVYFLFGESKSESSEYVREQMLTAQKLEGIGELAAGIAHEINTPTQYIGDNMRFLMDAFQKIKDALSAIEGGLAGSTDSAAVSRDQMLALVRNDDVAFMLTEIPSAIRECLEGNQKVAEIVRAVKEFAHPGAEDPVPVDIHRLIDTAVAVSRNVWKYVATVETDYDAEIHEVTCVPGALSQVILNILLNASHAIGEVKRDTGDAALGVIRVRTRRDGDWVEIQIEDTGCGIPEDIQARIFQPFFTTKKAGHGTGQGLAIAIRLVEDRMLGALSFESTVGAGTTFFVRIPAGGIETMEGESGGRHVQTRAPGKRK